MFLKMVPKKSSFMDRKAQIGIQFNRIFILIVGGIILLFFVSLAMKFKDSQQTAIETTIKEDFKTILSGVVSSPEQTARVIEMPTTKIKLRCEPDDGFSGYIIGRGQEDIGNVPFFAPTSLEHDFLTVWTYGWEIPYKVTNFLYLTNSKSRYILLNDSQGWYRKLNNTLKSRRLVQDDVRMLLDKEVIVRADLPGVRDENHHKAKIVYFADNCTEDQVNPPDDLKGLAENDLSAVCFEPDLSTKPLKGYGEVYFYAFDGNDFDLEGVEPYLGKASLLGAFFAANKGSYRCGMQKAFKRLGYVSTVYEERSGIVEDLFAAKNSNCETYFGTAKRLYNLTNLATDKFNYTNVKKIYNIGYVTSDYNNKFIVEANRISRDHSCGAVY